MTGEKEEGGYCRSISWGDSAEESSNGLGDAKKLNMLTGARLMAAANDTLERVVVVVAVTFLICNKAVGTIIKPPPEHEVKPKKSINDCSPAASKVTCPLAEGSVSV